MTNKEFADEFDVLYNSITSNQAPGLNSYEKSVLLTKAQDDIIKSYFNFKLNKVHEGYDQNPRRQVDFSSITECASFTDFNISNYAFQDNAKSVSFSPNKPVLAIINERLTVLRDSNKTVLTVVPIQTTEFDRLSIKPYARPYKNQAWRLITSDNNFDLIPGPSDIIQSYDVRYIRKPRPIILEELPSGYSIEGEYTELQCELPEILHLEILQRAVEFGKSYYQGDLQSQLTLGQISQTNIGVVPQSN